MTAASRTLTGIGPSGRAAHDFHAENPNSVNELGAQYPFSLLSACAYPAQPAAGAHQLDALTEVCRAHTQVTGVPPEAD